MSKGKEVMAMGVEGEDGENDDDELGDGGRKRQLGSPNQDSPKRLKIQQDLNFSPKEEAAPNPNPDSDVEEDSSKRVQIEQDLNRSPDQEEEEEAAPNPGLLFEKELTERDTTQWRMFIRGSEDKRRVLNALREDEVNQAREKDGLSVATTDADGAEYTLILRIGHYMTLAHQWTNITDKYKPKAGDSVQVFASRDAAAGDNLRLRLHFITN